MLQIISAAIGNTWELSFEIPFILWLQSLGGKDSVLYYLMNFISMFGEEMILVGIIGLIYWGLDKQRGQQIGFTMISATLLNPMIKNIACRTRPFDAHPYNAESGEGVQNLRDVDGYSFPSGHSSGAVSVFLGTAAYYKKRWLTACGIVIPILVAFSRVYLGAHYPTDVLAGLALGAIIVYGVRWLYKVVPNKFFIYFGAIAVGFAGIFYCTTSDYFTAYGLLIGFVFAMMFEEKVVKFKNTKTWWRILLRVAVGGALYYAVNTALKALVGCFAEKVTVNGATEYWYDDGNHEVFSDAFRVARYAVISFLLWGVYPLLFAQTEKLWKKLGWVKTEKNSENTAAATENLTVGGEPNDADA